MTIRFTKMHGAANDYVYVDGFADTAFAARADLSEVARAISDRHTGVGSDGLILVLPPEAGVDAHIRMRMFNSDGSESEMCGNGVRCVAKYAHDRGLSRAKPMRVQTGRGVLSIDYTREAGGKLHSATVDMGEPILAAAQVPVSLPPVRPHECVIGVPFADRASDSLWPGWRAASGWDGRATCVSMGNPHVILLCSDVKAVPLEMIGPVIETADCFPRRINVHIVQRVSDEEVIMRTWERGAGITQACGTGACAVCVAGVLNHWTDRRVLAHLPGGDLMLAWDEASNHVFMTGGATEVFRGEWDERR